MDIFLETHKLSKLTQEYTKNLKTYNEGGKKTTSVILKNLPKRKVQD